MLSLQYDQPEVRAVRALPPGKHYTTAQHCFKLRLPNMISVLNSAMTTCRKSGWDIDCVVPVPDGSRPAAIQISAELGLPYREGLVKNRYVGRTFIMPDQRTRELSVRRKLNAMPAVFSGKKILLVDDSIVRGTTMSQIVDMVRKAGAEKVMPQLLQAVHVTGQVWCQKSVDASHQCRRKMSVLSGAMMRACVPESSCSII